jgi:hypothetical protein
MSKLVTYSIDTTEGPVLVRGTRAGRFFAVRFDKALARFKLDHIPTGALLARYVSKEVAIGVGEQLSELFPEDVALANYIDLQAALSKRPDVVRWFRAADGCPNFEDWKALGPA